MKCIEENSQLAIVTYFSEVQTCFYHAELASKLFCGNNMTLYCITQFEYLFTLGLDTVYAHLDSNGKMEWDIIKTLYHRQQLTLEGYQYYLQILLDKYNIKTIIEDNASNEQTKNSTVQELNIDQCQQKLEKLKIENSNLKKELEKIK